MNSFNQSGIGQFQANCANTYVPASGTGLYQTQPSSSQTSQVSSVANTSLMAMQQFATQSAAAANFVTFQPGNYTTVNCLQKEIETLKKANSELQTEVEKLRAAYADSNYQMVSTNMKLSSAQEQIDQLLKENKELKSKYQEKYSLFQSPHQSDERSLFCDECNFEVKSQVALFIHKLNHHFESSIPRHLQLSTRSFSSMPDDSIQFKYRCHCCEIDSNREFARHEIYVHIYQFHTFDLPFKCKFCFLYFTSKSYLNDHLIEKHSQPNRQGKKRKGASVLNGAGSELKSGCISAEQLNSTLQLNPRTSIDVPLGNSRKPKIQPTPNHHHQPSQQQQPAPQPTAHLQDDSSGADINELFQQLVGDTIGPHQSHHQEDQQSTDGQHQQLQMDSQSSVSAQQLQLQELLPKDTHSHPPRHPPSSSSRPSNSNSNASASTGGGGLPNGTNSDSMQQIMNDLDGDDSLNCKYPGCKFLATTKNHLKFHICAHLMSKYKCPYCTFVGNRIIEIKRHILKSSKHTDQHVFLCPDCDFASDCEKTFKDHYSRYHNGQVDIGAVIEQMFLNESGKVGKTMLSAIKAPTGAE